MTPLAIAFWVTGALLGYTWLGYPLLLRLLARGRAARRRACR